MGVRRGVDNEGEGVKGKGELGRYGIWLGKKGMALAKVTLEKENKQYCSSAARPVGTALALVGYANESRQQNHSKDPGAGTVQLWAIPF